jgi:hypothetical protein
MHVTMNNRAGKVCDSDTRNALCDATDVCNRQSYYTATFTAAPRDYRQSPARVKGFSKSHDLAVAPLSSDSMYAGSIGTKGEQTAANALAPTVGVSPTLVLSEQARALNRVRGAVSVPSRVPVTGLGDVVGFSTTYKCAPCPRRCRCMLRHAEGTTKCWLLWLTSHTCPEQPRCSLHAVHWFQ